MSLSGLLLVSAQVGGPLAGGGAYAGIVKKVKFGTPTQVSIPGLDLELSKSCEEKLRKLPMSRIASAYVVREVLKAEISEQTCGKVDARGSFVGLGSAEAEYAAACAQASLEPVAVGYRTVPLVDLLNSNIADIGPVKIGGASGGSSIASGGFDASGTLAQIQAAKDLETLLNAELDACLDNEERKLLSQANADASSLSPLLKETSAKAKELGAPEVNRYTDYYGAAEVTCTNDLGQRKRAVSVPAVSAMRAWAEAPASEGAVADGTWSEPNIASTPTPTSSMAVQNAVDDEKFMEELNAGEDSDGTWTGPSGYTMMAVPGGTYEVGCTASQSDCDADEKPPHSVRLRHGILMGKTEVTQGLWQSVMGSNPSGFTACGPTCPLENVSWVDAVKFANALSKKDTLEECYTISGDEVSWPRGLSCTGYRLPTEAEWEVAARGGRDSLYAGGSQLTAVGWTRENSNSSTHPVGQMAANGYGIYDMTGNVWEWTWDWFGAYSSGRQADPQGAGSGSVRVFRGGSWFSADGARVAFRSGYVPADRNYDLGFRLARTSP